MSAREVIAHQQITAADVCAAGRRLVVHLKSLVDMQDLGALALLRRGLGREPGEVPEMFAHVLPYLALPGGSTTRQRELVEDAALLAASLFALWHQGRTAPRSVENLSIGVAFRQLARPSNSASVEHRFVALLKAGRDQLPGQLRHAVSLLKAKDIPLDWELLFRDLSAWDLTDARARHPVRRRWARDYWERGWEPEVTEIDSDGEGDVDDE